MKEMVFIIYIELSLLSWVVYELLFRRYSIVINNRYKNDQNVTAIADIVVIAGKG